MTTIAYDGKTMAADRLRTCNGVRIGNYKKIEKLRDGRIFGFCGEVKYRKMVLDHLKHQSLDPLPEGDYCALVVRKDGSVYTLEGGSYELDATPPIAMGSGGDFAMAAMACGKDAKGAIEIAIRFDTLSGGEIDEVTHGD